MEEMIFNIILIATASYSIPFLYKKWIAGKKTFFLALGSLVVAVGLCLPLSLPTTIEVAMGLAAGMLSERAMRTLRDRIKREAE